MAARSQRAIAAIPIRLGFDVQGIKAITEHDKKLVIASDHCQFYSIPLDLSKYPISAPGEHEGKRIKMDNSEIRDVASFRDQLLIHIVSDQAKGGILLGIPKTGQYQTIDSNTYHFATNQISQASVIAVSSNTSVGIYQYENSQWRRLVSEELSTSILAIALNYPKLFALSANSMILVNFQTKSKNQIVANLMRPMAFVKSPTEWSQQDSSLSIVVDDMLSCNTAPMNFTEPAIDHAKCGDKFCSISDRYTWIYDFKNDTFTTVLGAKRVCSYNGSFIVASSKALYVIRDFSDSLKLVESENYDQVMQKLPSNDVDTACAFFEYLWNYKPHIEAKAFSKRAQSLSLLSYPPLNEAVGDVLRLFSNFVLDPPVQSIWRLQNALPNSDDSLNQALFNSLFLIHKNGKISDDSLMYTDTAICEFYSQKSDLSELKSFLASNPKISSSSFQTFCKKNSLVLPFSMFLLSIGSLQDAITPLAAVENKDKNLLELVYEILSASTNFDFVLSNIDWLFSSDPIIACKVLTSPSIDISKAKSYSREQRATFYPRVLLGSLYHPLSIDRSGAANELITLICHNLISLKSQEFKTDSVCFLECVITKKTPTKEDIEGELVDMLIQIVRDFPSDIDTTDLLAYSKQISNKKLQVEVYRLAGQLSEALGSVWKKDGSGITDCEKLCRGSDDPKKAFGILLSIMKKDLSPSVFVEKLESLIMKNYDTIDIASAFSLIGEEVELNDVSDFIARLYCTVKSARRDAELDAKNADSERFESEYKLITIKSDHVALRAETKCAGCGKPLGFQYVQRTANGSLYHFKCLPSSGAALNAN